MEELIVKEYFTTLDSLLTRRFRRLVPGLVEEVLALNQGLSSHGTYLPIGLRVKVPIIKPTKKILTPVKLWG